MANKGSKEEVTETNNTQSTENSVVVAQETEETARNTVQNEEDIVEEKK